jgi:hypothetical protein
MERIKYKDKVFGLKYTSGILLNLYRLSTRLP